MLSSITTINILGYRKGEILNKDCSYQLIIECNYNIRRETDALLYSGNTNEKFKFYW